MIHTRFHTLDWSDAKIRHLVSNQPRSPRLAWPRLAWPRLVKPLFARPCVPRMAWPRTHWYRVDREPITSCHRATGAAGRYECVLVAENRLGPVDRPLYAAEAPSRSFFE